MKSNSSIENKVDTALSSIDNIKPALPSAFFYSRVVAKLNSTTLSVWEKWSGFFLRPTIAFATICFILAINCFVLISRIDHGVAHADQTEVASSDEFSETITGLYDLENGRP